MKTRTQFKRIIVGIAPKTWKNFYPSLISWSFTFCLLLFIENKRPIDNTEVTEADLIEIAIIPTYFFDFYCPKGNGFYTFYAKDYNALFRIPCDIRDFDEIDFEKHPNETFKTKIFKYHKDSLFKHNFGATVYSLQLNNKEYLKTNEVIEAVNYRFPMYYFIYGILTIITTYIILFIWRMNRWKKYKHQPT